MPLLVGTGNDASVLEKCPRGVVEDQSTACTAHAVRRNHADTLIEAEFLAQIAAGAVRVGPHLMGREHLKKQGAAHGTHQILDGYWFHRIRSDTNQSIPIRDP